MLNLQNVGAVNAKPAGQFKVGEKMLWNYGVENEIASIESETPKTVTMSLIGSDGKIYSRKFNKSRLVGFAS